MIMWPILKVFEVLINSCLISRSLSFVEKTEVVNPLYLEALAIKNGLNPEGGTRNYNFSTYDSYSRLHEHMRLWRSRKPDWMYFLRAESFYNVATKEMEYSGVLSERYHDQSHGQSFFSVLMKQTNKNGLYFLDEPEAALSC